jgi:hypothetical protein
MRVMKSILAALSLLLASAAPAAACSCVGFASAEEHLAGTDVVFIGRVVDSRPAPQGGYRMVTTFEVIETLKGAPGRIVRVAHSADVCCICGLTFRRGQEGLVFAHAGVDGGLSTSSCSAPRFSLDEYREGLR